MQVRVLLAMLPLCLLTLAPSATADIPFRCTAEDDQGNGYGCYALILGTQTPIPVTMDAASGVRIATIYQLKVEVANQGTLYLPGVSYGGAGQCNQTVNTPIGPIICTSTTLADYYSPVALGADPVLCLYGAELTLLLTNGTPKIGVEDLAVGVVLPCP